MVCNFDLRICLDPFLHFIEALQFALYLEHIAISCVKDFLPYEFLDPLYCFSVLSDYIKPHVSVSKLSKPFLYEQSALKLFSLFELVLQSPPPLLHFLCRCLVEEVSCKSSLYTKELFD